MSKNVHLNERLVPQPVSSGFNRRKGPIIVGFSLLTVVYCSIYYLLQDSGSYLKPADRFCENYTEGTCSRPDLFAFQVSSGIMLFYAGYLGFKTWHISRTVHTKIPNTPEGRLFGYLEEADTLTATLFVFQAWDFVVSLFIAEHSSPIFLTHHALSGFTAWYSLEYQVVHYYAVFFGGLSEVSSIFLVFCDLDVYFPTALNGSFPHLPTFIFACQALFVLFFFAYRVIGWWIVSYRLWQDAAYAWKNNIVEQYRPGKTYFLPVFLFMDVSLGLLQLYWFILILRKIGEILSD